MGEGGGSTSGFGARGFTVKALNYKRKEFYLEILLEIDNVGNKIQTSRRGDEN